MMSNPGRDSWNAQFQVESVASTSTHPFPYRWYAATMRGPNSFANCGCIASTTAPGLARSNKLIVDNSGNECHKARFFIQSTPMLKIGFCAPSGVSTILYFDSR